MSGQDDVRVIRRGGDCEVGANWWKTVLLLVVIAVALILVRRGGVDKDGGASGLHPIAETEPSRAKTPSLGAGTGGLFPIKD